MLISSLVMCKVCFGDCIFLQLNCFQVFININLYDKYVYDYPHDSYYLKGVRGQVGLDHISVELFDKGTIEAP